MKLLTIREVADRLSISQSLAYRLVAEGKIRAYRIGGAVRVSEDQLSEYLSSCEVSGERTPPSSRSLKLKHLV